jgi:DNA-binding response OmpR family regulator
MTKKILIVSDDELSHSLRRALEAEGLEAEVTEEADEGYRQLISSQFDLAIIDLATAITGVGLLKRIRSNPGLNRLFVLTIAEWGTGQPTIALAQGADAFEPKPVDSEQLVTAVKRLLKPKLVKTAAAVKGPADSAIDE